MTDALPFRLFPNPRLGVPGVVVLPQGGFRRAAAEIRAWPGHVATRVLPLPGLAEAAGVALVNGMEDRHPACQASATALGSVQVSGAGYAVARLLMAELARAGISASTAALMRGEYAANAGKVTLACAPDGGFAAAVAWAAAQCGACCVAFVPADAGPGARDALAGFGASLRVVPGDAGDALRQAVAEAATEGWTLVSDLSWSGYTEVPRDVMQGYRLVVEDALDACGDAPTHVFVPGGVGGLAAAASVQLRQRFGAAPPLVVVEPEHDARLLGAALTGMDAAPPDASAEGPLAGAPSLLAWQELERAAFAFMSVGQASIRCARGMVQQTSDGLALGLAGLLSAGGDAAARQALGLGSGSRVLVLAG